MLGGAQVVGCVIRAETRWAGHVNNTLSEPRPIHSIRYEVQYVEVQSSSMQSRIIVATMIANARQRPIRPRYAIISKYTQPDVFSPMLSQSSSVSAAFKSASSSACIAAFSPVSEPASDAGDEGTGERAFGKVEPFVSFVVFLGVVVTLP